MMANISINQIKSDDVIDNSRDLSKNDISAYDKLFGKCMLFLIVTQIITTKNKIWIQR